MFSLYKEEFLAVGGTQDDMNKYSVQRLMSKVNERFEDILIDKLANKSSTFVFHSLLSPTKPVALRTEIIAMPPSKTPTPTVTDTHLTIPHLVLLFSRTVIGGLQVEPELRHSRDVIERRNTDQCIGCCVQLYQRSSSSLETSITWSRTLNPDRSISLLSILNSFGHCISYDEVKRHETEITYTCFDGERTMVRTLKVADDTN